MWNAEAIRIGPATDALDDDRGPKEKVVIWATEIAIYAAQLPSRQARDSYLAERHRELASGAVAEGAGEGDAVILADACVNAARRIMTELLAQRAGMPKGRA
jgi:hypothetical protein